MEAIVWGLYVLMIWGDSYDAAVYALLAHQWYPTEWRLYLITAMTLSAAGPYIYYDNFHQGKGASPNNQLVSIYWQPRSWW